MALGIYQHEKEKLITNLSFVKSIHPPNAVFGTIFPVIAITAITNETSSMANHIIIRLLSFFLIIPATDIPAERTTAIHPPHRSMKYRNSGTTNQKLRKKYIPYFIPFTPNCSI